MTAEAVPARRTETIYSGLITLACYGAMTFLGIGFAIVGATASEVGISASQLGILLALQQVGFAIGLVLSGLAKSNRARARILSLGCFIMAAALAAFFRQSVFALNGLLMVGIGVGMGTFEGTTDPLLIQIHKERQSRQINISHFFVTVGATGITAYLMSWPLDWHLSLLRLSLGALVVGLIFFAIPVPAAPAADPGTTAREPVAPRFVFWLFAFGILVVGAELATMGFLPLYLVEAHRLASSQSKAALLSFLLGVAGGRFALGLLVKDERVASATVVTSAVATLAFSALFTVGQVGASVLYALAFFAGAGVAGLLPLMLARGSRAAGPAAPRVMAILKLCIPVGGILAPVLAAQTTLWWGLRFAVLTIPICTSGALVLSSRLEKAFKWKGTNF